VEHQSTSQSAWFRRWSTQVIQISLISLIWLTLCRLQFVMTLTSLTP